MVKVVSKRNNLDVQVFGVARPLLIVVTNYSHRLTVRCIQVVSYLFTKFRDNPFQIVACFHSMLIRLPELPRMLGATAPVSKRPAGQCGNASKPPTGQGYVTRKGLGFVFGIVLRGAVFCSVSGKAGIALAASVGFILRCH